MDSLLDRVTTQLERLSELRVRFAIRIESLPADLTLLGLLDELREAAFSFDQPGTGSPSMHLQRQSVVRPDSAHRRHLHAKRSNLPVLHVVHHGIAELDHSASLPAPARWQRQRPSYRCP